MLEAGTLGLIGTIASAGASVLGAVAQSNAMKAQAEVDQARAKAGQEQAAVEGQWAERRAQEERASAQRKADARVREGNLATSRLQAVAAASGSKASDPTVMDLFGDIKKTADVNAANETATGEQRAAGLTFDANLKNWGADVNAWVADANANIKRSSADSTLLGGFLTAGSQMASGLSKMGQRYANYDPMWSQTQTFKYG